MVESTTLQDFSDYVWSFYGYLGIYELHKSDGTKLTREDVLTAIGIYFLQIMKRTLGMNWGDGDSLDRERVRYILETQMGFEEINPPPSIKLRGNKSC